MDFDLPDLLCSGSGKFIPILMWFLCLTTPLLLEAYNRLRSLELAVGKNGSWLSLCFL